MLKLGAYRFVYIATSPSTCSGFCLDACCPVRLLSPLSPLSRALFKLLSPLSPCSSCLSHRLVQICSQTTCPFVRLVPPFHSSFILSLCLSLRLLFFPNLFFPTLIIRILVFVSFNLNPFSFLLFLFTFTCDLMNSVSP